MAKMQFEFDVKLPTGDIQKTVVEHDDISETTYYDQVIENLVEMAALARKNIASRGIDYDSVGSDSDYLDMLDRMADRYGIAGFRVHQEGAEPQRYEVVAPWPNADNSFDDYAFGVSYLDAELQFAWIMATHDDGGQNGDTPADFENLVDFMSETKIEHIALAPVTKDELAELLRDYYLAHQTGEGMEAVTARVVDALEKLEMLPETPTTAPGM